MKTLKQFLIEANSDLNTFKKTVDNVADKFKDLPEGDTAHEIYFYQ